MTGAGVQSPMPCAAWGGDSPFDFGVLGDLTALAKQTGGTLSLEGSETLERGGDAALERAPSMEVLERLLGRSGLKSSRACLWFAEVYE